MYKQDFLWGIRLWGILGAKMVGCSAGHWSELVYRGGGQPSLAEALDHPRLDTNISAALVMVGFDLLVEPVAMQIDFWYWRGGIPSELWGWFLVGLIIQAVFSMVLSRQRMTV